MTTRSIRGAAALTRAAAAGGAAAAGASQHRLLRAALRNPRAGTSSPWLSEVLTGRRWPSIPSVANGAAGARLVSSAAAAATSAAREEGSRGARFLPGDVVLYQYEACPFCNKVKAFLDYYKIPYKVVEVNPINKKEIKWSDYKKVPILMVDGKQMNDSSAIIDQLFEKIHPDELAENEEERKWRGWVDNHLVHVLSPNIYRTPSEALESFDYITTHGNFSFMERLIAKYSGAAAMYMVSKKLKKRHNITDERAALYEAAETWVDALKGRPFCGGAEPNLADLAVFGVLRPIRHLQSGKDMVEHTQIGEWYDRMQHAVGNSTRAMTQSWQESREKI